MEINKRKHYYLLLDGETANSLDQPLAYDLGFVVCDRAGNVYEKYSFLVSDIFMDRRDDLMTSCYYADKLPTYYRGLRDKQFKVANFMTIFYLIRQLFKKYNIKKVMAYNASFDHRALNTTIRYLTKSKYRYFFPYGTEICCIWHMACQTILKQTRFIKWAIANGLVSDKGNIQTSAEVAYRYITGQPDFQEAHTGLQDVQIELQIWQWCIKQKKPMVTKPSRACWRIPTKKAKEKGLLPLPSPVEQMALAM